MPEAHYLGDKMSVVRSLSILGLSLVAGLSYAAEVEPALLQALRSNSDSADLSVIVNLQGRLDTSKLNLANKTQLERGRAIAKALDAFNKESSARLRSYLAGPGGEGVKEVTPLWITNSVRVRAPKEVINRVISMNGIESVALDAPREVTEMLDDVGNASLFRPAFDAEPKIGWGVEKVGATKLWEDGHRGKGALVAMIDTGANLKHPDLKPNLWKNPGETGLDKDGKDKATNGIDDDANGFIDDVVGWNFEDKNNDPTDQEGHGSQTAGLVAGMGAGGTQTGVAPGATVMILKSCCGASGKVFESNTWEAIQYAIKNGAKVISMSLSAKHPGKPTYAKWRQVGEVELDAQIIHVNSAGNMGGGREPHNIGAPPSNPPAWFHKEQVSGKGTSMISIGAADKDDKPRSYTSLGPVTWQEIEEYKDYPYEKGKKPGLMKPEVCGPSEVPSLAMEGEGYTRSFGGTSSATPQVAGVVALLVAEYPNLSIEHATEALEMSAKVGAKPFDNACGAGRVDAVAALEYIRTHFND